MVVFVFTVLLPLFYDYKLTYYQMRDQYVSITNSL